MKNILILGLGNTLRGDDGVGVRVVEALQKENIEAEVKNGANLGLSLLEVIRDYQKVIIVDAVDMGRPPGTVEKILGEDLLKLGASQSFSLHEMGLLEILKIGQSLNEDFRNVVVYGVQPKELKEIEQLTPEVEAKVPEVISLIKKEVE